jgi:hypothetical protein
MNANTMPLEALEAILEKRRKLENQPNSGKQLQRLEARTDRGTDLCVLSPLTFVHPYSKSQR